MMAIFSPPLPIDNQEAARADKVIEDEASIKRSLAILEGIEEE